MDLVAPGITCAKTRQHYALSEMTTVRIMQFEGVEAAWLWVTCPCGLMHNLAVGQLVDEARELPGVTVYSAGVPDLELVLNGVVGIPVNYDLNRPLSFQDQNRADFLAYLMTREGEVAKFEEELLWDANADVIKTFFGQIYNAGAWNANWRLLAG